MKAKTLFGSCFLDHGFWEGHTFFFLKFLGCPIWNFGLSGY